MLRHVFYSPHMSVPDNIVKQIAEGRPVVLALLCSGLRTYYLPSPEERLEIAGDPAVTGAKIEAWSAQGGGGSRAGDEPSYQRTATRLGCAYL